MTQHTDGTKQNKGETDIGRETELKVRITLKSGGSVKQQPTTSTHTTALALFYVIRLSRLNLLISVCSRVPYQLHSYHIWPYSGIRALRETPSHR